MRTHGNVQNTLKRGILVILSASDAYIFFSVFSADVVSSCLYSDYSGKHSSGNNKCFEKLFHLCLPPEKIVCAAEIISFARTRVLLMNVKSFDVHYLL